MGQAYQCDACGKLEKGIPVNHQMGETDRTIQYRNIGRLIVSVDFKQRYGSEEDSLQLCRNCIVGAIAEAFGLMAGNDE